MITSFEKNILCELAKRYAEIVSPGIQAERIGRMRDTNDLKPVRPPVLIDEIPWHEMDIGGELALLTEDPFARYMENHFRQSLFKQKHFRCDTVAENYFPVYKSFSSTGIGLVGNENVLTTDESNYIVSHEYKDVLANEAALEKMKLSEITAYPDVDAENVAAAEDILNGVLPVKLLGTEIYYAPWDQIPRYRGVNNILLDMIDRPGFLHKIIAKFTEEGENLLSQYETLGLLEVCNPTLHCTPSYISGIPAEDYRKGKNYKLKDVWFRSMAQLFGSVSPDMHFEFDLQYSMPLMEKCAYTYYGCCEALDGKIDMLKKIPNLRKIGVSPWADVEKCAEQIGDDYVLSHKPNPAHVAVKTDPDVIRAEISNVAEAALKYGCPCDITLKDISTVNYNPQNLIVWAETVSQVLDEYYG